MRNRRRCRLHGGKSTGPRTAAGLGRIRRVGRNSGTPLDHHNVAKRFRRLLKRAGLSGHFHLHCLRHTYASLLLQDGVSPAYVQEQLGHASVELTVGTYGRWLRKRAPGAVDRLDWPLGSAEPQDIFGQVVAETPKVVAAAASDVEDETRKVLGESRLALVTRLGLEPRTQRLRDTQTIRTPRGSLPNAVYVLADLVANTPSSPRRRFLRSAFVGNT